MLVYSAIGAILLALVHFFTYKLRFSTIPRSKWLSAAGGISVAYVFVHLLPELEEWQATFNKENHDILPLVNMEHHLYLLALLGLVIFYGLERAAKISKQSHRHSATAPKGEENPRIFSLHIGTFCVYNALIGYLLVHRDSPSLTGLALFVVAMIFHFMVNDYGLLDHYREEYLHRGRYLVSLAVLGGWVIGALTEIPETAVSVLFSFIAGSIVLNVLKEELPEERKSNFWAFLTGIFLYSVLLIAS